MRVIALVGSVGLNSTTGMGQYVFTAPATPGTYSLQVTNVSPFVNGIVVAALPFSVLGEYL